MPFTIGGLGLRVSLNYENIGISMNNYVQP